jgi:hypothetical protein
MVQLHLQHNIVACTHRDRQPASQRASQLVTCLVYLRLYASIGRTVTVTKQKHSRLRSHVVLLGVRAVAVDSGRIPTPAAIPYQQPFERDRRERRRRAEDRVGDVRPVLPKVGFASEVEVVCGELWECFEEGEEGVAVGDALCLIVPAAVDDLPAAAAGGEAGRLAGASGRLEVEHVGDVVPCVRVDVGAVGVHLEEAHLDHAALGAGAAGAALMPRDHRRG